MSTWLQTGCVDVRLHMCVCAACVVCLQTWPTTILVVSHDREFLNAIVTDILHLHTRIIDAYRGDYEAFTRTRSERLKNQQKEYDAQKQYRDHIQVCVCLHWQVAPYLRCIRRCVLVCLWVYVSVCLHMHLSMNIHTFVL